jgi:Phosphotransacetylase
MPYAHFDALLAAVAPLNDIPVAVVDAAEEHVLRGACEAKLQSIVDPILIGDENKIRGLLPKLGYDSGVCPDFRIIHVDGAEAAAEKGVELVLAGEAKALMKGHLHSDAFLHPILAKLRTDRRLSHVFVADIKTYPKLLLITDAAINIAPDLTTKAAILQNAIDLARILDVTQPKAAILSAVEVVNPAIVSTVDAACLSKMAERGQITGALVDGPSPSTTPSPKSRRRSKGYRVPWPEMPIFYWCPIWCPAISSPKIWNIWPGRRWQGS